MKLKHGINLGGYLSQCVHTQEHYENFIREEDIRKIRDMGFDHVRLPIDYNVLEDEDGNIRERGYERIRRTVDWCSGCGLNIILDLHKAYGYDFNYAGDAAKNSLFVNDALQERFVNLWKNIALRFGKDRNVAFELLNEVVENENAGRWNVLIRKTVQAIRQITSKTTIIYGGIQWNSATTLKYLEDPLDQNILFTFHFYEPLLFTHQKAHWVEAMDPKAEIPYPAKKEVYQERSLRLGEQGRTVSESSCPEIDIHFLKSVFAEAVQTAKEKGVGLYCGEFGVIDQAPLPDTLAWLKDVMTLFAQDDIGFALWTYKEMDFGLMGEHYAPIRAEMIRLLTGEKYCTNEKSQL